MNALVFHSRFSILGCDFLKQGAERFWLDEQKVPYAVKEDQWVGYDDEKSLGIKVA